MKKHHTIILIMIDTCLKWNFFLVSFYSSFAGFTTVMPFQDFIGKGRGKIFFVEKSHTIKNAVLGFCLLNFFILSQACDSSANIFNFHESLQFFSPHQLIAGKKFPPKLLISSNDREKISLISSKILGKNADFINWLHTCKKKNPQIL